MLPEKVKKEMEKYIKANPDSSHRDIAAEFDISPSTAGYYKKLFLADMEDALELDAVKKATEIQRLRDVQRIERGTFRKEARVLNSANALFEDLLKAIPSAKLGNVPPMVAQDKGTLVIQVSDAHFNETVSLPNNTFNSKVQSKRFYKYINAAISIGLGFGVRRAIFVLTGDLVNSARRQGEALSNEFNGAHGALMAFEVLSGAIEMTSSFIPVTTVTSVLGNEPRLTDELCLEAKVYMDNFDYIIHHMLAARFSSTVNFIPVENPVERLLDIDGVKTLWTHGLAKPKDSPAKQLMYYRAKYGRVDFVGCGHLHEALCAPGFARSGSTVGGNTYSEFHLGIANSTPSQTCHVIVDGKVYSFPIDLTYTGEEAFAFTEPPSQRVVVRTEVVV